MDLHKTIGEIRNEILNAYNNKHFDTYSVYYAHSIGGPLEHLVGTIAKRVKTIYPMINVCWTVERYQAVLYVSNGSFKSHIPILIITYKRKKDTSVSYTRYLLKEVIFEGLNDVATFEEVAIKAEINAQCLYEEDEQNALNVQRIFAEKGVDIDYLQKCCDAYNRLSPQGKWITNGKPSDLRSVRL